MLIRSTWTLTTEEPVSLPKAYGLELVKLLHSRLGIEMGSEDIPSTSFSGIVGQCRSSKEFLMFEPRDFYQLSLNGLQEESSKVIADLDLGDRLQFLGAEFAVVEREDEMNSYEELYHRHVADEPDPVRRFDLKFLTPTTFSQNRLYLPLPLPTLMFRSWLERWNHFAPVYLGGDELIGYLGEAIAVNRHRISTRTIQIHNSYIPGFIGDVSLKTRSRIDPLLANVANLLTQYSLYCGTGSKTRLGMGSTSITTVTRDS